MSKKPSPKRSPPTPESIARGAAIRAARERAGLTQEVVAERIGIKQQSYQAWEGGRSNPSFESLLRLIDVVNAPDLLNLVDQPNAVTIDRPVRHIPVISYVQAGSWGEATDPYAAGDAGRWEPVMLDLPSNAFALEIQGESMLPDFRPGDTVIVDPTKAPSPGSFVVAKNNKNEAMFKKYRVRGTNDHGDPIFELVPLNPDYPSRHSDQEQIVVIGVAVRHNKKL